SFETALLRLLKRGFFLTTIVGIPSPWGGPRAARESASRRTRGASAPRNRGAAGDASGACKNPVKCDQIRPVAASGVNALVSSYAHFGVGRTCVGKGEKGMISTLTRLWKNE